MKKYLLISAAALLTASSVAVAQSPGKGEGGNAPSANPSGSSTNVPRGKSDNAPSAKEKAPGQMKGDGNSATEKAPGQMKGDREPATDKAPGQMKGDRESAKENALGQQKESKSPAVDDAPGKMNRDAKSEEDTSKTNNANTGASDGSAGASEKGQGENLAEIPAEKKNQVRSAFTKHRVEPARDLNITVNVGVSVPRSVRLYSVPQDIVVIYPAYSSYRYFYYEDRICIVDRVMFEIVEIIVIA